MLLGGRRPTGDIDFGVLLHSREQERWSEVEAAITAAAEDAGVMVQYSTDIDRWSPVSVPLRQRKTQRLRQVGRVAVRLLHPMCWAVYKLARYLDSDVEDLLAVLRRQRVDGMALARLCGRALRASPHSSALFLFRRQVEHFFRAHGASVWGRRFDGERAVRAFHRAAGIRA